MSSSITPPPLLGEPSILDVDTTVKPLYSEPEGAVVSYNPAKPGRPSHTYHSYMVADLETVAGGRVCSRGNQHSAKHSAPDLWALLRRLGPGRRPRATGDNGWSTEGVMREAEQRGLAYLFRLRLTPDTVHNLGGLTPPYETVAGPIAPQWYGPRGKFRSSPRSGP